MAAESVELLAQYLTFKLDHELFAVDIAKVREVLEFTSVTTIPRTPDYMRGVINLRGNVVPVVDLRLKLGLTKTERTVDTCVVITEVGVDGEKTVIGALADSVQEVIDLHPSQVVPPPRIGTRIDTPFIKGMGKRDEQFLIILDIDKVFSATDLEVASAMSEAGAAPAAAPRPAAEPVAASA